LGYYWTLKMEATCSAPYMSWLSEADKALYRRRENY
jgi:hypothetical protein